MRLDDPARARTDDHAFRAAEKFALATVDIDLHEAGLRESVRPVVEPRPTRRVAIADEVRHDDRNALAQAVQLDVCEKPRAASLVRLEREYLRSLTAREQ